MEGICVVCIRESLGHAPHYPDWRYKEYITNSIVDIKTISQLQDAADSGENIYDGRGCILTGVVGAITIMNGNLICKYHAINTYWNNGPVVG